MPETCVQRATERNKLQIGMPTLRGVSRFTTAAGHDLASVAISWKLGSGCLRVSPETAGYPSPTPPGKKKYPEGCASATAAVAAARALRMEQEGEEQARIHRAARAAVRRTRGGASRPGTPGKMLHLRGVGWKKRRGREVHKRGGRGQGFAVDRGLGKEVWSIRGVWVSCCKRPFK